MPDFEFWISENVVIPAAGLLFALVMGAIAIGPLMAKPLYKRFVWSGVVVTIVLTLWQLAKKEEENAKPEHDYAYLRPSTYQAANGLFYLYIISTGTMRNVRIAVRRIAPDGNPEPFYIFSNGMDGVTVDEGSHLSNVALPVGNFAIDIDPPTKYGKVDERLKIEMKNGSPTSGVLRVTRKGSLEVLIPASEKVPLTHKLLLLFFVSQFIAFVSILGWASWITA
jgi:hypothetical protein